MKCFDPKETKITFLTTEQAKKLPENILACGKWWWLRSPGDYQYCTAIVHSDGVIYEFGYSANYANGAVRPAFKIANLSSEFGERVYVGKLLCAVIDKDLVLADECVCYHRFDVESNDWNTSELKAFIESEAFAKNYLEEDEPCSNPNAHQEAMNSLSITDVVKTIDYINELITYISADNEVLDRLDDVMKPLVKVQNKLKTKAKCPKCKSYLFKSDLPQYDYVCVDCDENFFECEL